MVLLVHSNPIYKVYIKSDLIAWFDCLASFKALPFFFLPKSRKKAQGYSPPAFFSFLPYGRAMQTQKDPSTEKHIPKTTPKRKRSTTKHNCFGTVEKQVICHFFLAFAQINLLSRVHTIFLVPMCSTLHLLGKLSISLGQGRLKGSNWKFAALGLISSQFALLFLFNWQWLQIQLENLHFIKLSIIKLSWKVVAPSTLFPNLVPLLRYPSISVGCNRE